MKLRDLGWPLKAVMDDAISEALDDDPKDVAGVLAAIVDRCKAEGVYTEEEIEDAAQQLCRGLGITREWQAFVPRDRPDYSNLRPGEKGFSIC